MHIKYSKKHSSNINPISLKTNIITKADGTYGRTVIQPLPNSFNNIVISIEERINYALMREKLPIHFIANNSPHLTISFLHATNIINKEEWDNFIFFSKTHAYLVNNMNDLINEGFFSENSFYTFKNFALSGMKHLLKLTSSSQEAILEQLHQTLLLQNNNELSIQLMEKFNQFNISQSNIDFKKLTKNVSLKAKYIKLTDNGSLVLQMKSDDQGILAGIREEIEKLGGLFKYCQNQGGAITFGYLSGDIKNIIDNSVNLTLVENVIDSVLSDIQLILNDIPSQIQISAKQFQVLYFNNNSLSKSNIEMTELLINKTNDTFFSDELLINSKIKIDDFNDIHFFRQNPRYVDLKYTQNNSFCD